MSDHEMIEAIQSACKALMENLSTQNPADMEVVIQTLHEAIADIAKTRAPAAIRMRNKFLAIELLAQNGELYTSEKERGITILQSIIAECNLLFLPQSNNSVQQRLRWYRNITQHAQEGLRSIEAQDDMALRTCLKGIIDEIISLANNGESIEPVRNETIACFEELTKKPMNRDIMRRHLNLILTTANALASTPTHGLKIMQ